MGHVAGVLLAAGAGRRFGGPKALARDADGTPWLAHAAHTLGAVGLEVLAVLPASHPESLELLPSAARGLLVDTVEEGLSASLRIGLQTLADTPATAALITLVDLPGLPIEVVTRILSPASPRRMKEIGPENVPDPHERVNEGRFLLHSGGDRHGDGASDGRGVRDAIHAGSDVLRRAVFGGRPGHPVLIGRDHWPELIQQLHGDTGASAYLREHGAEEIACSDLWDGADIDVVTRPNQGDPEPEGPRSA